MRLSTSLSAVTAVCFLAAAPFASATVINTVQLSAASGGGQVTVSATSISFHAGGFGVCPQNNAAPYNDGTNFCDASVSGGNMMFGPANNTLVTTSFNAIIGDAVGNTVQQPWIMIDDSVGNARIEFFLQGFNTPVTDKGTNCAGVTAGQTCVAFVGSPFTLQGVSGGTGTNGLQTAVTLSAFGLVEDMTTLTFSAFSGSFSQTIADMAPVDLQTLIPNANSTNSKTTGFTGSFTATIVPEPGTVFMMAFGGLFMLAGAARRRRK